MAGVLEPRALLGLGLRGLGVRGLGVRFGASVRPEVVGLRGVGALGFRVWGFIRGSICFGLGLWGALRVCRGPSSV